MFSVVAPLENISMFFFLQQQPGFSRHVALAGSSLVDGDGIAPMG
jgi:hypothetical protein